MNITLRRAKKEDCDLLYNWANDPVVRKNAFNSEPIKYKNHKKWFAEKLSSDDSFIYIGKLENKPVGQIRIDVKKHKGIIDYSIAKQYRGNGYGTELLKKILNVIKQNKSININKLVGKVKFSNVPSQKSFEKAGYTKYKKEKFIKYFKKIEKEDF